MNPTRPSSPRTAALLLASALFAPGLVGCDRGPATPGPAAANPPAGPVAPQAPPAAPAPAASAPFPEFTDVADAAGFVVTNHTGKPEQKDWIVSAMGGGAIVLDYDSDGDMDVVVVDGTMLDEKGILRYDDAARTRLFRNDGGMKFTDVTKQAGIDIQAFGFGGASCDYDADGHPDFYVCCWGLNHLMHNRGDGTFEDVTAKAGVAGVLRDMSTACSWGDVNGDGIQDLYVANYSDQQTYIDKCQEQGLLNGRNATWREFRVYVGPAGLPGQMDRLYFGNGDGTFREVTETNLLDQRALYSFGNVMTDVDNDGDLDIFVANDTQSNHLWINDGKGVFRDRAVSAAVAMSQDMAEQAGMGVDAGDWNRDGWMDLTVTNFSHDYNTLYLNRTARSGVLAFTDSSNVVGLATASYYRLCWGVGLVDLDLDGWLDYFTACGHVYGEMSGFEKTTGTAYRQRNQVLRNLGPTSWKMQDMTDVAGPGLQVKRVWRGTCFGDFDDDGDTDVYVAALNDRAAILRNDGGNRNAFLRFRLKGKAGLLDPSGARVILSMPDGRFHISELHHGASFLSDNDSRLLFGCGQLASIAQVEIVWPGGAKQTFKNVPTRKAFIVEQGRDELLPDPSLR
ncbi:MAG: CRTAC1 family protein [Planctomycetes bacterium]|nr:CRTAC1 family protein [Planctomycetota bacterium]